MRKPPFLISPKGGKKGDSHDWNLGPTGARGGPCVVRYGEARLRLETQAGRACAIAWSGGKIRQVE